MEQEEEPTVCKRRKWQATQEVSSTEGRAIRRARGDPFLQGLDDRKKVSQIIIIFDLYVGGLQLSKHLVFDVVD